MPQAGYSGTPLPKKLGIADGHRVAVIGGPDTLAPALADAVPTALVGTSLRGRAPLDIIVLFLRSRAELLRSLPKATARLAPRGGLWIAWPKRSSGVPTDLVEDTLREVILTTGLVDNKVCAIDETWSGLRFVRRVRT